MLGTSLQSLKTNHQYMVNGARGLRKAIMRNQPTQLLIWSSNRMDSSIWVNYNNSLTWIVRPFWDDFPNINHDSRVRSQWGRYNFPRIGWVKSPLMSCWKTSIRNAVTSQTKNIAVTSRSSLVWTVLHIKYNIGSKREDPKCCKPRIKYTILNQRFPKNSWNWEDWQPRKPDLLVLQCFF